MTETALLIAAVALLLVVICAVWLQRMRKELTRLRAAAASIVAQEELPPELVDMARDSSVVLSLQVLNPMELAAQRHWLAGAAGRLTPGVVRPIVAREVLRMVRSEMVRYGVKAGVRLVSNA